MAPGDDAFDVDVFVDDHGPDIDRITDQVLEEKAIETQNEWVENLRRGIGAEGSHGGPYVNTGEAINDITVDRVGTHEWTIGGDVVQLAIAEFGRAPGTVPPYDPIADWCREKGLTPGENQTFEQMVDSVRFAIAQNGLEPFAPATGAYTKVGPTVEGELGDRLQEHFDQQDQTGGGDE